MVITVMPFDSDTLHDFCVRFGLLLRPVPGWVIDGIAAHGTAVGGKKRKKKANLTDVFKGFRRV